MNLIKHLIFIYLFYNISNADVITNFNNNTINNYIDKYGLERYKALKMLDNLIDNLKNKNELNKISHVNKFFNTIPYSRDIDIWNKSDYWASPLEVLGQARADCEDYAISKYLILKKLKLKNMKFAYMKYKNEMHLALIYKYKDKELLLDNINKKITLLNQRKDLILLAYINPERILRKKMLITKL